MAELGLSMDDVKNIYSEDSDSISSFDSNVPSSDDIDKQPKQTETKPVEKPVIPASTAVNASVESDWDSEDEEVTEDKSSPIASQNVLGKISRCMFKAV